MSLNDALFVSATVHERKVVLADGSEHVLHFKEIPAVTFRAFHKAEQSDDESEQAGSIAKLIAASLCEPDGKPAISYKKALELKAEAANSIVQAILDVNGFGGKNA